MKIWRRPKITEVLVALLIVLAGAYFLERRIPGWAVRKQLSQAVAPNFEGMDLQGALQSMVQQTDGTVTMTVCTDLTRYRVSLHPNGPIPLKQALYEIASQIPANYYPYGMLDVAAAHPVFLCKHHNETAVTIKKTVATQ